MLKKPTCGFIPGLSSNLDSPFIMGSLVILPRIFLENE